MSSAFRPQQPAPRVVAAAVGAVARRAAAMAAAAAAVAARRQAVRRCVWVVRGAVLGVCRATGVVVPVCVCSGGHIRVGFWRVHTAFCARAVCMFFYCSAVGRRASVS